MSENLRSRWESLQDKTNALSVRERGILLVTLLCLISIIWIQLFFLPWEAGQKKVNEELSALQKEQSTSDTNIKILNIQLTKNPNDELKAEIRKLNTRLDELGREIETRLAQLLAPQQMVAVMQQVLSDYQGMKLLGAKNLPATPLDLSGDSVSVSNDDDEQKQTPPSGEAVVYSHVFEMTLEGSYFQTLRFLQRLEQLEGFFWRSIDYQVSKYPKAEVVIQITTLSLQEEWIGV